MWTSGVVVSSHGSPAIGAIGGTLEATAAVGKRGAVDDEDVDASPSPASDSHDSPRRPAEAAPDPIEAVVGAKGSKAWSSGDSE
jgi:hypothetical protein